MYGTGYDRCSGRLVMDGTTIVEALGITTDPNSYDFKQVSNSAVVFCAHHSEVYITAPWPDTGIFGGSNRTTFSGFML